MDESAFKALLASLEASRSTLHWWLEFWTFLVVTDFQVWERGMNTDYAEIDTDQLFPDERLRFMRIADQKAYFSQRRVASIDEQAFIAPPERARAAHSDSGFWGGTLGI